MGVCDHRDKNNLMMKELARRGFQVVEEDAAVVTLRQTASAIPASRP